MNQRQASWWQNALMVVYGLVMVVPGMIMMLGLGCYMAVISLWGLPGRIRAHAEKRAEEETLRRELAARGRFIAWPELQARLDSGHGTLIVEECFSDLGPYSELRLWWTEEEVLRLGSIGPPAEDDLDYFGQRRPHPFVEWCHGRYLSLDGGIAMMTDEDAALASYDGKDVEGFVGYFRKRYPRLSVVHTAFLRQRCGACGYDLRATAERCPECGTVSPPACTR